MPANWHRIMFGEFFLENKGDELFSADIGALEDWYGSGAGS